MSQVGFEAVASTAGRGRAYDLSTWRLAFEDPTRAVFRPTLRTLPGRILYIFAAAVLFIPVYVVYQAVDSLPSRYDVRPTALSPQAQQFEAAAQEGVEGLRRTMDPEEFRALEEQWARDRASREAKAADRERSIAALKRFAGYAYAALGALLGLLAVLPTLSLLWNRVTLERTVYNEFVIDSWHLRPRRRVIPLPALGMAILAAREHITFARRGRVYRHGWRWHVLLRPKSPDSIPPYADFIVGRQKNRPQEGASPPAEVARFVEALRRLAGVEVAGPAVLDARVQRGLFSTRVTYSGQGAGGPVAGYSVTRHAYRSLDEVPPELRPEVEQMMAQARATGTEQHFESTRFVVRDESGREQIYHSPDEMPPEVRTMYEELRRRAGNRPSGP